MFPMGHGSQIPYCMGLPFNMLDTFQSKSNRAKTRKRVDYTH
jgi:hypothetical protein